MHIVLVGLIVNAVGAVGICIGAGIFYACRWYVRTTRQNTQARNQVVQHNLYRARYTEAGIFQAEQFANNLDNHKF